MTPGYLKMEHSAFVLSTFPCRPNAAYAVHSTTGFLSRRVPYEQLLSNRLSRLSRHGIDTSHSRVVVMCKTSPSSSQPSPMSASTSESSLTPVPTNPIKTNGTEVVNQNNNNNNDNNNEDEDEEELPVQGPSQAPTKSGISTAGLNELEVELIEASYNADVKKIERALDTGVDVNTADLNGRTSLHFCSGNGLHVLVKRLISLGATINKQDLLGYTPLHIAAGYRMPTTVKALLELGADANVAANDGKLPVEIAEELLERTPKKRAFILSNPDHEKLSEVVRMLDEATELEDDDEDDDVGSRVLLQDTEDRVEKIGDTTFTVRVKSPKEMTESKEEETEEKVNTTTSSSVDAENVDVKVTVKEPVSNSKGSTGSNDNNSEKNTTSPSSSVDLNKVDVKITVKEPGTKKEKK